MGMCKEVIWRGGKETQTVKKKIKKSESADKERCLKISWS